MTRALPPGYRRIAVRTTYLEMREPPLAAPLPFPAGCEVREWKRPETGEYRALFQAVGGEWGWSGRLLLSEKELRPLLASKTNEIYRLYCDGDAAGFVELDRGAAGLERRLAALRRGPRRGGEVEIAYFGLLPGSIGKGLGRFFLDWAIRKAWEGCTQRVWLHTCEFDHPRALGNYLRAGFTICGQRTERQPYPGEFAGRRPAAGG